MEIRIDDLKGAKIKALLQRHGAEMEAASPPESCHYLDIDALRQPEITFWTIWEKEKLLGCGALKQLSEDHGEIKSMHVHSDARGKGIAETMLVHIIENAKTRGYYRLSLETGSMDAFLPAKRLYKKFGFALCPPFEDYKEDPNSIFMTRLI